MQAAQYTCSTLLRYNILFGTNAHWVNCVEVFSRDVSGEISVAYGLSNALSTSLGVLARIDDVTLTYTKCRIFSSSKKSAFSNYSYTCGCIIATPTALTSEQCDIIKDEYKKLLNAWFSSISKINNPIYSLTPI